MTRQFLIIDADDTLWENNIYFERAFDEFVEFLGHSQLSPREVRDVLDEIEAANARIHGYGSLNFGRNLRQCYEHLAEGEIRDEDLRTVMGFAERILAAFVQRILRAGRRTFPNQQVSAISGFDLHSLTIDLGEKVELVSAAGE